MGKFLASNECISAFSPPFTISMAILTLFITLWKCHCVIWIMFHRLILPPELYSSFHALVIDFCLYKENIKH